MNLQLLFPVFYIGVVAFGSGVSSGWRLAFLRTQHKDKRTHDGTFMNDTNPKLYVPA